jgi:hypothetical protein
VVLTLVLATVSFLGFSALSAGASGVSQNTTVVENASGSVSGYTVVTADPHLGSGDEQNPGAIMAFDRDGDVRYYNDTYTKYYDVDPSPVGRATVLYVSGEDLNATACPANRRTELMGTRDGCRKNVVERLNLTTGEVTRVHTAYTDWRRWHDVDRVDEDRIAVTDMARNRVFILNTTSDIIEWQWDVQSDVSVETGGAFPQEFTHVNDVEVLSDGRLMVSLRNQDRVVFLTQDGGVQRNWTLGSEDDYSVLYEQHNPDYIPAERGGPAVVVADSENNRVLEYQRVDDGWERTWVWSDARMRWPRDADRLPNGHTLVTDSNGGRVLELDRSGEVVWSVPVDTPYDAERLGTGPESAGGQSARALDLASRSVGATTVGEEETTATGGSWTAPVINVVDTVVPELVLNGLLYVLPAWMSTLQILTLVGLGALLFAWGALEFYWSAYRLRLPVGRTE